MKVLLCNPPWWGEDFRGVRAGSRWPHKCPKNGPYTPFPFFMAYAAAVLEERDIDVLLVDAIAERFTDEKFMSIVSDYNPDIIVIETSTPSIDVDLDWAKKLKAQHPQAKIVFCGAHAEMFKPPFLERHKDVDFIMKGEYEYTLHDLIFALILGISIGELSGILFRSNGKVVFTGDRPLILNIDDLPWPARHFLPMNKYHDCPGGIPKPSVMMWASRGCPYGCNFCVWPQIMYGSRKYRTRNPVDVVDEMEHLIKQGFKSIYFDDDTFNIGKERILKICDEINRRQLKIPWAIMARADTMDREMLVALKGAGLKALKYGVESASQEILDRCGKALDLRKAKKMIQFTKEMGIKVHLTFTFGLPGETKQTIDETIKLALSLRPQTVQFSIATPWPGTRFYEECKRDGLLVSEDYSKYTGSRTAVVRTEALTPGDLEAAYRKAHRAWRERK